MAPMQYVIQHQNLEFVEYLLKHNANPNIICSGGNTPMHTAMKTGNEKLVMMLVDAKGDLNVVNNQKQTPLAYASEAFLKSMNLF
jgi:uncharacterized protein